MKCPKCGSDNPEGTLFCEECDWRVDQPVKNEMSFPKIYIAVIAMIIGIAAVLLYFIDVFAGALVAGAVGMVLGGYSMTFSRITDQKNKSFLLTMTTVAICMSVIGFIMGLVGLF